MKVKQKLDKLLRIVAMEFNTPTESILSKSRWGEITKSKVVFSVVAMNNIINDKSMVARVINRDRGTVGHYLKNLQDEFKDEIEIIEKIYLEFYPKKTTEINNTDLQIKSKVLELEKSIQELKKLLLI